MLPFNKNKSGQIAGIIMKTRSPDEDTESNDNSAAIDACAKDLIQGISQNDAKKVAEALKSAFQILESMPHEEGESEYTSKHTYEDQNIKAAKGE